MGEPIVLHNKAGQTLHVYTRNQAENLISGGSWFATAADAEAGKVREEPTPATAAKLAELEGDAGGGDVTEVVTDPPAPAPVKAGKRPKGKGL